MDISSDQGFVGILYQLLPGFIVAWIFYGLTAYLKPPQLERIIQALIFTVIVRAVVIPTVAITTFIIDIFKYQLVKSNSVEFIFSFCIAIFLGLFFSWCVNNDFPFYFLRSDGAYRCGKRMKRLQSFVSKISLTSKTLYPSEWFSAFNSADSDNRYIVLHLTKGRRLMGLPYQFPNDPNSGHFLINYPVWLLENGEEVPLYSVHQFMISAKDVERIEFLKHKTEITESDSQIKDATKRMTDLYLEEEDKNDN